MIVNKKQMLVGFALGIATGALLMAAALHFKPEHHKHAQDTDHIIKKFAKGLDLSADQYAGLRKIIVANDAQMKALNDEDEAKEQEIKKAVQAQIRQLLNATQQAEFDKRMSKMNEHEKHEHDEGFHH
jgi:Na+-transporting NADH:ubiquinone oxidoreductase subunit NqrC